MPTWPTTLPAVPQVRGYEEQTPVNVIRTEMEVGPAKVRRRMTAAVRKHKMVFHMTQDQVEIFDQFLAVVLADGALAFDYTQPRTGDTVRFRIIPPATYTTEKVKTGAEGEGVWWVTLDLEQLPG
jgi:hypothetical protein